MNTQETFYCFRVQEFKGTYEPITEIFELTKDEFDNHIDRHPYWDKKRGQFEQPLLWGYDDYNTAYAIYTEAKLNAEFWYAN